LDLSDELLIEAKAAAARRRTTLRAIIEHALRRELYPASVEADSSGLFEMGPLGILRLKKRGRNITPAHVREVEARADQDELERALEVRRGKRK
jgi:hypothetical protein